MTDSEYRTAHFVGYKFREFVKIVILQKINFADCKHNLATYYSCPFIFVEIIFALWRETVKFAKFIAVENFALYSKTT